MLLCVINSLKGEMVEVKYWPTYNGNMRQNIRIIIRKEHPVNQFGLLPYLLLQGNLGLQGTSHHHSTLVSQSGILLNACHRTHSCWSSSERGVIFPSLLPRYHSSQLLAIQHLTTLLLKLTSSKFSKESHNSSFLQIQTLFINLILKILFLLDVTILYYSLHVYHALTMYLRDVIIRTFIY